MKVHIKHEPKRGCGYRSPGAGDVGLYLFGHSNFEPCERLPFPLTTCPCCGAGLKFSRGFTWINPIRLFDPALDPKCNAASETFIRKLAEAAAPSPNKPATLTHNHNHCAVCNPWLAGEKAGLMWVGERYYPTPHHFLREAAELGISKKIGSLPNGFNLGEHTIYLAHRKAVIDYDDAANPIKPGVFMSFRPDRLDLIINDENNIPDKAITLKKQLGANAQLIKVIREKQKLIFNRCHQ